MRTSNFFQKKKKKKSFKILIFSMRRLLLLQSSTQPPLVVDRRTSTRRTRLLGLGVDVCCLSRVSQVYARWPVAFPAKILSPSEALDFEKTLKSSSSSYSRGGAALRFLATRFSLKESAYKALSAVCPSLTWKDLTLSHSSSGTFFFFFF